MTSERSAVTVAEILRELDCALSEHMAWLKVWHRAFLCGDSGLRDDLADDPRDLGRFGTWYVRNQHQGLVSQPAIRALATLHREIHERAYALAKTVRDDGFLSSNDYDAFMDLAASFVADARRLEKAFARASSDLDPLTGLHNRQAMSAGLERERERALRVGRPCCFALADLDHFKSVNDRYGHAVGDQVLMMAAECFLATLRPYDTVYRYGGEEFLFCLPDVSETVAKTILDRVLDQLRTRSVLAGDGKTLSISCSFGVAQVDPKATWEQTIEHADQALYHAKKNGRGQVWLWSGDGGARTTG
jgi:diguanylate cyclase (GGDEF)-like protein